jgi:hypothetical protein
VAVACGSAGAWWRHAVHQTSWHRKLACRSMVRAVGRHRCPQGMLDWLLGGAPAVPLAGPFLGLSTAVPDASNAYEAVGIPRQTVCLRASTNGTAVSTVCGAGLQSKIIERLSEVARSSELPGSQAPWPGR